MLSGLSGTAQYRAISNFKPISKPAAADGGQTARKAATTGSDTLDLSTGLTLEKIQDLLKTKIGEKVAGLFEEAGIDPAHAAGVDFSPEATADRIVGFSTGLFDAFKAQNSDLGEDELIDKFESTIRGAVDKGAGEAFAIIGATLGEGALEIGHKTIDLVHEKYDDFFANLRGEGTEQQAA